LPSNINYVTEIFLKYFKKEVFLMADEGGYIYGQDENPHAVQSKDKVIGKVDMPADGSQVDDCNVAENVEYSDKTEECE